ncbi:unnamed protein product [Rhodiola kirilowii]
MDLREGQNITRPPLLEGNKYGYWRVRMKAFLKSQDESVWDAIEQGWTHPVATDKEGKISLLAKNKWPYVQRNAEAANSKAMNAIFSGVDGKNFKMISTCEIAKKAWDILQTAHEGTSKVKISRMETVTSKFENLRMQEDETIADFNTRVLDISNEAFALGEPMSEETLVRKVLRSLTKRYAMKALAVKEANDVKTMRLDELMGSLQSHEMDMNEEDQLGKDKSVGLKTEVSVVPDKMGDLLEQQYAMFAKKFGKFMRRQYGKGTESGQPPNSRFQKNDGGYKKNQSGDSDPNKGKGIQCRECEGYGHIRAECINTQKKKNAYVVSWSDSESDQEGETNNFVALTSYVKNEGETSNEAGSESSSENPTQYSSCNNNEEIIDEDFAIKYKELFQEWLNEVEQNKILPNNLTDLTKEKETLWEDAAVLVTQKVELQQTITDLQAQVVKVKDERDGLYAQKAELLATISSLKVQIKRSEGNHPEDMSNLKKKNAALKRQEVILLNTIDALKIEIETDKEAPVKTLEDLNKTGSSSRVVSEELPPQGLLAGFRSKRQDKRRCFNCNQVGHLKSRCPELHNFIRRMDQLREVSRPPMKQIWRIKQKETCLAAFSSTFLPEKQRWYFDSGCSRHMTGNPGFLTKIEWINGKTVAFGDGIEGRVVGRGTLNVPGLPRLTEVSLVEGLQANLISISQLYDGNNQVQFTQDKCIVQNNHNQTVLTGRRASNNCYLVDSGLPTAMTPYMLKKDLKTPVGQMQSHTLGRCTCVPVSMKSSLFKYVRRRVMNCCHRVKTSTAWIDCHSSGFVRREHSMKGSHFESCYTKMLWKKMILRKDDIDIEGCYTKKLWKKSILEQYRLEQEMIKQQSESIIRGLNNTRVRTPRSSAGLCVTNN